jgi:hypothetical protein
VRFQAHETICNVAACVLEALCKVDVAGLIKSCFQLHKHCIYTQRQVRLDEICSLHLLSTDVTCWGEESRRSMLTPTSVRESVAVIAVDCGAKKHTLTTHQIAAQAAHFLKAVRATTTAR